MTRSEQTKKIADRTDKLLEYILKIFGKVVHREARITVSVDGEKIYEMTQSVVDKSEEGHV